MNVLIVSDDPERESFRQISILKRDIEDLIKKQVDLVAFSSDGVFLNQEQIKKELSENAISDMLEDLLRKKGYSIYIISLRLEYLKQLFSGRVNALELINNFSPRSKIFIFGAESILKTIRREQRLSISSYPRYGVSKLTQDFKSEIITYVKSLRR